MIQLPDHRRTPTNLRNALIVEAVANCDAPTTPSEINQRPGHPKQTIHHLRNTSVQEGFPEREPYGQRLRPAFRLRSIGSGILHFSRSSIARHQILVDIAARPGEAVNFIVPHDTGMHYVDHVGIDWPLRTQLPVGTNVPFHCTTSGKVFLASLPLARRRRFVSAMNLKRCTQKTVVDSSALIKDTERVAQRGYALDDEELFEDMTAVSVPVTDDRDRYVASLAFQGPRLPGQSRLGLYRRVDAGNHPSLTTIATGAPLLFTICSRLLRRKFQKR